MDPLQLPEGIAAHYEPISIEVHDSRRGGSAPDPDSYEYFTTQKRTQFILYKLHR